MVQIGYRKADRDKNKDCHYNCYMVEVGDSVTNIYLHKNCFVDNNEYSDTDIYCNLYLVNITDANSDSYNL